VETRKRREDRWERNVLELGGLLTTSLTDRANELYAAQLEYRGVRDRNGHDRDLEIVARQAKAAEQQVFAYGSLISTQMDWLIDRVTSLSPKAPEIKRLKDLTRNYWARAIVVRPLPEHDISTDAEFDKAWQRERDAREALIAQVKQLADLPHPPHAPWLGTAGPAGGFDLLGGPDQG
jgi:hypothetical protein